ncbi:MAG: DNA repair protein RadC [Bacteroidota bacterium]
MQTIKSWAEDDRPREKFLLKGRTSLSDSELLAILLGSGSTDKSAVDLAKEILAAVDNDLYQFSRMNLNDLCKFKGVGPAKAITILASLELGRRKVDNGSAKKLKITSSKDAYLHAKTFLSDLEHEEFYCLFLNRANEVIKTQRISTGSSTGTVVDGKMIFKMALEHYSTGIILLHNHPSGQCKPSEQDKRLTKQLVEFGKHIDLTVYDHLIFTDQSYFSFADEGIL